MITFLVSITQGPRNLLPLFTCCTCSLMVNRGVGDVIRCDNVLDDCSTGPTELVAVVCFIYVKLFLCVFLKPMMLYVAMCMGLKHGYQWWPILDGKFPPFHRRFTLMRSLEKSTFNSNWGALPALVCCSHPKHRRLI